jgi:hypothetical protein
MPTRTTIAETGSKSVPIKTRGHEKITDALSSCLRRKSTPFVILKRRNLPKGKLPSGIIQEHYFIVPTPLVTAYELTYIKLSPHSGPPTHMFSEKGLRLYASLVTPSNPVEDCVFLQETYAK